MKKLFTLLTLFIICTASAQKIEMDYQPYSAGVDFRMTRIKTTKISDAENGKTTIAKGDSRFRTVMFEFKNNTEEEQPIDFETVKLVDSKNNKYYVKIAMSMGINTNPHNLEFKLKGGKTKSYMVEFWPPAPKDETSFRLEVHGELSDLVKQVKD
ncbi:hypothetical protein FMM05_18675 [Flavobacterium zepuense]|uniref:DUF4352 domain-containing protein n=1 Tax=Flavobacterium zepuense TaxID=2593302 RepID=A0A552UVG0_9FLAO|nr:hypothetical protein [Flavobacterium zepuense]TRW22212.1 hypothetical protein FMM05_18675 [Flavobacterium zepuense]